MCTGTELLFLPGSARFLSDWSAAGGTDGRIQVFLLCGRVSSVVWLDLRTIYLRMAVSVRLVQDLLHKIPVPGKRKNLPGHRHLVWLKYGILAVFVVLLPMFAVDGFGQSKPWFCQYICPSGTLMAGIPLVASSEALQAAAGALFNWKVGLLIVTVLLAVWIYRPFCKYLCPLGAIYSLFNPISIFRLRVDREKCTQCGACAKACGMHLNPVQTPNHPECIRCGACQNTCPSGAIHCGIMHSYEKKI